MRPGADQEHPKEYDWGQGSPLKATRKGARPLLDLSMQRFTLSPSVFGLDGQKGGLQPGEVTDLLVRDLFGVGRHGLHKGGPLDAKLLDQSRILGHRCTVVIHSAALSDAARPNLWSAGLFNPHLAASLVQASGGQSLLKALEGFSEQAGLGWIVNQPRGPCSLEEIVSRYSDPRLALNQLQEVEQMGLDVVQPGFSLGVLLNLEKRLLNARNPLLQHVGEWGMHGSHSRLAEDSTLVMVRCRTRLLPSDSKERF